MINKEIFKWFVRGFALTSLVLLAVVMVVRPTIGWAQGGGEENPNANSHVVDDTPPDDPGTDDPEGREPVPASSVVDSGELRSNQDAMVVDDAPPHDPGTDDPEGREPAPASSVVDSGEPLSNQDAMVVDDAPPHDPGTDAPEGDPAGIGAAGEINGQSYTSPLVISAADFSSDGGDPDGFFFSFSGGYVNGSGSACLKAPAYLPAGATVTSVYAYLYDNDSTYTAYIDLRRVRNMTGVQNAMAAVSTSGYANSTSIRYLGDTTISYPTVSNLYSYYVTTCLLSANTRIYAVRIFYTGP